MSVASFRRLTAAQPILSDDLHRHHAHAFEAIAATRMRSPKGREAGFMVMEQRGRTNRVDGYPLLNAKIRCQASMKIPRGRQNAHVRGAAAVSLGDAPSGPALHPSSSVPTFVSVPPAISGPAS